MDRLIVLALVTCISIGLAGCGSQTVDASDPKAFPTPTAPTPAGQAPKKAGPGMIDDFSVKPAPPGIKTGTPGEGGKW